MKDHDTETDNTGVWNGVAVGRSVVVSGLYKQLPAVRKRIWTYRDLSAKRPQHHVSLQEVRSTMDNDARQSA
jgi:hypothetical protein